MHLHRTLPSLVHQQRCGSSASLGTEPQMKTLPLACVPPLVLALGNIFVVTYWDFEIVKRSPETNAIREALKVIKSLHEIHAFFNGNSVFWWYLHAVLGCSGWLPIPDCPTPPCLPTGPSYWVAHCWQADYFSLQCFAVRPFTKRVVQPSLASVSIGMKSAGSHGQKICLWRIFLLKALKKNCSEANRFAFKVPAARDHLDEGRAKIPKENLQENSILCLGSSLLQNPDTQ